VHSNSIFRQSSGLGRDENNYQASYTIKQAYFINRSVVINLQEILYNMDLAITIFNILTALSLPISTCLQEGIESADCLGHSVTFLIIYTVICACYVYRFNRLVLQRFAFELDLVDDFDWREVARVLVSIAVYFIISALVSHSLQCDLSRKSTKIILPHKTSYKS
jgi:hypothetical protein